MTNYFASPFKGALLSEQVTHPNIIVGRYSYYSGYYHGHLFDDCAVRDRRGRCSHAPQSADRAHGNHADFRHRRPVRPLCLRRKRDRPHGCAVHDRPGRCAYVPQSTDRADRKRTGVDRDGAAIRAAGQAGPAHRARLRPARRACPAGALAGGWPSARRAWRRKQGQFPSPSIRPAALSVLSQ
jgi:hypothetical protein